MTLEQLKDRILNFPANLDAYDKTSNDDWTLYDEGDLKEYIEKVFTEYGLTTPVTDDFYCGQYESGQGEKCKRVCDWCGGTTGSWVSAPVTDEQLQKKAYDFIRVLPDKTKTLINNGVWQIISEVMVDFARKHSVTPISPEQIKEVRLILTNNLPIDWTEIDSVMNKIAAALTAHPPQRTK